MVTGQDRLVISSSVSKTHVGVVSVSLTLTTAVTFYVRVPTPSWGIAANMRLDQVSACVCEANVQGMFIVEPEEVHSPDIHSVLYLGGVDPLNLFITEVNGLGLIAIQSTCVVI